MSIAYFGKKLWANALGNTLSGLGEVETITAATPSSNTLGSLKAKAGGTTFTNLMIGKDIVTGKAIGTIIAVPSGTEVQVARWEVPGSRETVQATLPSLGTPWVVVSGATPGVWMALSTEATEKLTVTDVGLSGEIIYESGQTPGTEVGLTRTMATFAYTEGTNTYTYTKTFEAKAKDKLPVTIQKIGVFNSGWLPTETPLTGKQPLGYKLFETKLTSSATLSSSGDSVAITDTVTGS